MQKRLADVLNSRQDNYIIPLFWVRGESADLIHEEMERVYQCGIKAICVEARPHPDYIGPLWWRDMDIILEKARELDMKVWILDDSHFPTGRFAGKITAQSPYRKQMLTHTSVDVVGPMKDCSIIVSLDKEERFVGAIMARRDSERDYYIEDQRDISDHFFGNVIEVDVPEGIWSVTVIKTTYKHTARPDYANLIDKNAVRFFLDTVYEAHYTHYAQYFGNTIAGFFSDEPELGNVYKDIVCPKGVYAGVPNIPLPWCKELEDRLQGLWEKEYCKNLAVLWDSVDKEPDKNNRTGLVRWQYTDTLTRLYEDNFSNQIGDWCRAHGVEYIGHVVEDARLGMGVGHFFRGMWGQDMAGIDVVLQSVRPNLDETRFHRLDGKTLVGNSFLHFGLGKIGSSLAHIDPKKKGRALCEIFGAYGWSEGLKLMKWLADHMLVRGINYYVPHAFSMKEFPDSDCPPHFYARGQNPQYPYFKLLMQYLNRMCHLLNSGIHCAQVGVLYSADFEWLERDNMPFADVDKELMQNQIDFDVIPLDCVLDGSFENGRLLTGAPVYDKETYIGRESIHTLIVPTCRCVNRNFADWCVQAMHAGLEILFVNHLPAILEEDGTLVPWKEKAPEVVGLSALSERILCGAYSYRVAPAHPYLRCYHYKHRDGEYYLFFNESTVDEISTEVFMDVPEGQTVVQYDAWQNHLISLPWDSVRKCIPLKLSAYEMIVVSVGDHEGKQLCSRLPNGESKPVSVPWKLYLKPAGEKKFLFDQELEGLKNITAHDMNSEFCGTMKYCAEITIANPELWKAVDFGLVYETAELWVNGISAGCQIQPPYQFDIAGLLHAGENQFELHVVNTVVHRVRDRFSSCSPMEPSGMLGPVTLISY